MYWQVRKAMEKTHGLVLYARRDTPAPHIELDDELREHYKLECAKYIIPAKVDVDLFTCVVRDVDKKSCHYS